MGGGGCLMQGSFPCCIFANECMLRNGHCRAVAAVAAGLDKPGSHFWLF